MKSMKPTKTTKLPASQGSSGFSLPFDVARRFAQPLGIHLEEWESRIIQTEKGVVTTEARHRPCQGPLRRIWSGCTWPTKSRSATPSASSQMSLFPEEAPTVSVDEHARQRQHNTSLRQRPGNSARQATTLDRVHAAMLLQASGRTEALRNLLRSEQDRGPDFLRLANALSALYPRGSEEKRLLDGMLLAVPR